MLHNKKYLIVLVSVFLISSCHENNLYKSLNLKITKISEISIAGFINNPHNYIQPFNSEYLIFLNNKNQVIKLDLSQMNLSTICDLDTDTIMNWFYDDSKNEFYTIHFNQIFKFGSNGEFIDSTDVPSFKNGFFELSSKFFNPIIKNENIYFNFFPKVDGNYKNKKLYFQPIEGSFNYKENRGVTLIQDYPHNYKRNCYGYNYSPERIEISNEKHAYTFSYNDSIFIVNLITNERKQFFLGSHKKKIFNYIKYDDINKLNNTVFDELFNNNPFYLNTKYAPLAKKIYRFLYDKRNPNSIDNLRECSMILYDDNFNYIGEIENTKNIGSIIDSKLGLLSMTCKNSKLIISKITW